MSTPLTDREYEALASFRSALRMFQRFSEQAARAEGLTPAQHQLLLAIRGFPGPRPPSIGVLAHRLQTKPHSVLGLVERAASAGLIDILPDPDDGRRRIACLTPTGARVLEALSAAHRSELRRFRDEMAEILGDLD